MTMAGEWSVNYLPGSPIHPRGSLPQAPKMLLVCTVRAEGI